MKILCIIPARSGSKGVKDKNIKLLNGIPLMSHSIVQAKSCNFSKNMRIDVSTDSEKYRQIAIDYGAEAPFLRPEEISGDFSTDYECFIHCIDWLKDNENYEPDIILHLRPTQPCRDIRLIEKCIDIMEKNMDDYDSVRTVIPVKKSPYKMYNFCGFNRIKPIIETADNCHNRGRQYLPKTYLHNGYVDVVKTSQVLKRTGDISGVIYGVVMDEEDDYDIDTEKDFERVLNNYE